MARPKNQDGKTEATRVKDVQLVRFGSATGCPLRVRKGGRGHPLAGRTALIKIKLGLDTYFQVTSMAKK